MQPKRAENVIHSSALSTPQRSGMRSPMPRQGTGQHCRRCPLPRQPRVCRCCLGRRSSGQPASPGVEAPLAGAVAARGPGNSQQGSPGRPAPGWVFRLRGCIHDRSAAITSVRIFKQAGQRQGASPTTETISIATGHPGSPAGCVNFSGEMLHLWSRVSSGPSRFSV